MPIKQNEIEIGNGAIVVHAPGPFEIARVRGLFTKLFHVHPEITISGRFGRWDMTIGNPRKVVFVGSQYIEVDMAELGAVTGETQRPVRLHVTDGTQVKVRFKMPAV